MPRPCRCGAVAIPRSWAPLLAGRSGCELSIHVDTPTTAPSSLTPRCSVLAQLVLGEGDVTVRCAAAQHVEPQRMRLRGRQLDHLDARPHPAT